MIIAALIATAACAKPAQVTVQTARLVPSLFGIDTRLPFLTGPDQVARDEIAVGNAYPGATIELYRPAVGRHPALVISLGIEPAPADDPRVVSLLSGLAGDGIVAALVQSPNLNAGRLTPDAPDLLVSAYQVVASQPFVLPGHVGLLGLSVGGSLSLIAAADPRIAGEVRLVEAVGAYNSLQTLARAVVTNSDYRDGRWRPWHPASLAQGAVLANLAGLVPASQLDGLVSATRVDDFNAAVTLLPASATAQFDALSPAPHVRAIRAPVFIMVDQSDTFIPPSESASLAAELKQAGHPPYYSSFDILQHVEPGGGHSPAQLAGDTFRLFVHIRAVLDRL